MAQSPVSVLLALCVLGFASPLSAQDGDRIWGQVFTASGEEHERFIHWGRHEGSWVDVLDGRKDIPRENYVAWLEANDGELAVRTIELRGHRISWEEEHPDFSLTARSGIRFGHVAPLQVIGPDRAELLLRSGQTVELTAGGNDLGSGLRRLIVDTPGQPEVRLRWLELERVVFSAVPRGARATSHRLHGTVEDELGRLFTGYVTWDLDEIFESDLLEGEEADGGEERRIAFGEIASIERTRGGAQVAFKNGEALELTGGNDVDEDNRGIQISDPALGLVEVEWEQFRTLRLHQPSAPVTYDAFGGSHLLHGTVTTQDGAEIEGVIRWDADEAGSWEFLDGRGDDVVFTIEMSQVGRIERGEASGALVTLVDGRSFQLDESNDVDWDNKGIMVAPEGADHSDASAWRLVSWDEFREIRFR